MVHGTPAHVKCHSYYASKGKGLDTCYNAAYISQTRDQQRFTILEVAATLGVHSTAVATTHFPYR